MKGATHRIALVALLALLLALPAGRAEAHANLVRATPEPGATLDSPPPELTLEFSEALDPTFSRVQLLDSRGATINGGPGTIDSAEPTILRLKLDTLPKGSYTAIWRARSAMDGHVSEGNIPFGVGVAPAEAALIPPPGAPDPATPTPPLPGSLSRWLVLLTAALAFGPLPFALFAWRPAVRRAGDTAPALADERMTATLRRLVLGGGAAFLLANLLFLLAQAADAANVPLAQVFGAPLLGVLDGASGTRWIARIVLALGAVALAWIAPPAGRGSPWRWWAALALASGALLTISLNGHGAALPAGSGIAIGMDWLHLAGMVAWFGGLPPLALAISRARRTPEQALPLGVLVPRFSVMAIASVLLIGLSGIYSYFVHIGRLDLLPATTYGRALLVKTGLFAALLAFGAVNLLALSPRLRQSEGAARRLGGSVRVELVLAALLLLAAGAMTSVATGSEAWQAKERQGIAETAAVGDVSMVLRVAPAQIGDNEFAVDVTDRRPGAADAPSKVLLRFGMQGMEMGQLQTEARPTDTQRYLARGSFLSMGGRWNVDVILRRAGFDDIQHTFQVDVLRSAISQP